MKQKKNIDLIIVYKLIIIVLLLLILFFINILGEDINEASSQYNVLNNYKLVNGVYIEENLSEEGIDYINEAIEYSGALGQEFQADRGQIIYKKEIVLDTLDITFSEESDNELDYYIAGLFNANSNSLLPPTISVKADQGENYTIITILHELGHYLDYKSNYISKSNYFEEIYIKYKDTIFEYEENHSYTCSEIDEYFAQSFVYYTLCPEELKATQPEIYYLIEEHIVNI